MAGKDDRQVVVRREELIFECVHCGSKDLRQPWAGRTDHDRIYLLFACGDCQEVTPIEIDRIIAPLYETQILLSPGSKAVN